MGANDDAMGTVMRLGIAAEALAALGARLRADVEEIELDRDVAAGLDEVVALLGVDVVAMTAEERRRIAMSARALLLRAADLLGDPGRPPGWAFDDPAILLSTGSLSAGIAGDIAELAPALDGLHDALQREGAMFLDVGAGLAVLSIASARRGPDSGSSVWSPGLRPSRWPRLSRFQRRRPAHRTSRRPCRRRPAARPALGRLRGRWRGARRADARGRPRGRPRGPAQMAGSDLRRRPTAWVTRSRRRRA